MEQKKSSPTEVAAQIGVGVQTVRNWANGQNVPDALTMDDLGSVLGAKLFEIYPLV